MSIKPLDLLAMGERANNIYEAIVVVSKRSRQINEEMKIEFNQRIELVQPRVYDQEEISDQPPTNPDQILIAQEFERRPKPTDVAIREIMAGELEFRYKEEADTIIPL